MRITKFILALMLVTVAVYAQQKYKIVTTSISFQMFNKWCEMAHKRSEEEISMGIPAVYDYREYKAWEATKKEWHEFEKKVDDYYDEANKH